MYDIKWIRENPHLLDSGLKRRGLEPLSQKLLAIDGLRRARIRTLERWQETRNTASKEIGHAKAKKDDALIQELMAKVAEAKQSMSTLEREVKESDDDLRNALSSIPNIPADDVPDGTDEKGNVERKDHAFGTKPNIALPKQHFELGEALGLMDFEAAAKLSGSRFVVLKGQLARLERAISQFFLDTHTEEFGYTEVAPPILVRDAVMFGTAQLPKFEHDQFTATNVEYVKQAARNYMDNLEADIKRELATALAGGTKDPITDYSDRAYATIIDFLARDAGAEQTRRWLIPTAEVPLTNLVRESIVAEEELPLRYTACTPCFRAEAGAAGKDTRGMLRQHQFTKVELVSITTPEQSKDEHERMLGAAEEVLKRLDLPFRVMTLCTGDMGFASTKTYDIEVWLPGQNAYREISSCSNCGAFQARRMFPGGKGPAEGTRYRGKDGKVRGHVHTLNGSGVAVGRALIAVMENYQDENGAIAIPDALQPYMGGLKKIEKKQ